jgi:hypothetical protein
VKSRWPYASGFFVRPLVGGYLVSSLTNQVVKMESTDLLRQLCARWPEGFEAPIRYGLHLALGVDPWQIELNQYVGRFSTFKHGNGFGVVRLDYRGPADRGHLVFALDLPQMSAPDFKYGRPTYFGAEGEQMAALNLIQMRQHPRPNFAPGGHHHGPVPHFFG